MEKETTENEKRKKEKRDVKKSVKSVLALVLVAVVSIVGTLAFLQDEAEPKENVFLGSAGIDLKVEEPNYDKDKATDYAPGSTIPKDPILINRTTTNGYYEWVAIKVSYQKLEDSGLTADQYSGKTDEEKKAYYPYESKGTTKYYTVTPLTYEKIKNVIEPIVFNGDDEVTLEDSNGDTNKDWYELDDGSGANITETSDDTYVIYMYKKRLASDTSITDSTPISSIPETVKTTALFDKVEIRNPMYYLGTTWTVNANTGENEPNPTAIPNSEATAFPKFRIDIEAAAVKDEGYKYTYDSTGTLLNNPADVTCIEEFAYEKDANNNTNEADLKAIQNELLDLLGSTKDIS